MGMLPRYRLINAVERARQHPETFEIPSKSERENLEEGSHVKVIFMPGERIWIKVLGISGNRFRGKVDNIPIVTRGIKRGDIIRFGPEHIIDIKR